MAPVYGTACRRASGLQRLLMLLKRGSTLIYLVRFLTDLFKPVPIDFLLQTPVFLLQFYYYILMYIIVNLLFTFLVHLL